MSAPTSSLPVEIKELMTVTVTWESFLGFDGHAEPSYAAPVTLSCWQEAHSLMQTGLEAVRQADLTVSDPDWDLFFSGDDPNAQQIKLYDRFTPGGFASSTAMTLQATSVNTIYGPPFDNSNPWLIVVAF